MPTTQALQQDDESIGAAAKFYNPDIEELVDEEDEESSGSASEGSAEPAILDLEICLPNEERNNLSDVRLKPATVSDTSICPHFYGAFQGTGVSGYQTGIILMEKLSVIFHELDEMAEQERRTAYDHVPELHRRGIHHGDAREGDFGRREQSTMGSSPKRQRMEDRVDNVGSEVVVCDFCLVCLRSVIRRSAGSFDLLGRDFLRVGYQRCESVCRKWEITKKSRSLWRALVIGIQAASHRP